MKKQNLITLVSLCLFMCISLTSCQAIAGIFKAGVWVGILIVVIIIAIIFWIISKAGNK